MNDKSEEVRVREKVIEVGPKTEVVRLLYEESSSDYWGSSGLFYP